MATILNKKYTKHDSKKDLLEAIITLANDKHTRILINDNMEWLDTKMKEVLRLARILKRKIK